MIPSSIFGNPLVYEIVKNKYIYPYSCSVPNRIVLTDSNLIKNLDSEETPSGLFRLSIRSVRTTITKIGRELSRNNYFYYPEIWRNIRLISEEPDYYVQPPKISSFQLLTEQLTGEKYISGLEFKSTKLHKDITKTQLQELLPDCDYIAFWGKQFDLITPSLVNFSTANLIREIRFFPTDQVYNRRNSIALLGLKKNWKEL